MHALGQILCCPKCQSLVQVPESSPDSVEETKLDQPHADAERSASETYENPPGSALEETPEIALSERNLSSPPPSEIEENPSEQNPSADNQQLLPSGDWTSASTQRTRQWVLYMLAAAAGIALALLAASQFKRPSAGSAPVVVELRSNDPRTAPPATDPADGTPSAAPLASKRNSDNSVGRTATDTPTVAELPVAELPVAELPVAELPVAEPTVAESPVAEPTEADSASESNPLPVGLDSQEHRAGPAPIRPPPKSNSPSTRKGATRRLDIETQLARSLESFEIQRQPLLDFARFVSEFTYLPVTLDPVSLQKHEVSPLVPVSTELNQTSFQDLLTVILAPIELTTTYDANYGIIIHHREDYSAVLSREIDVHDLATTPTQNKQLCHLIQSLVAPATWRTQGGTGSLQCATGTLIVHQTHSIHTEVERFCTQLRRARKKLLPAGSNASKRSLGGERQLPLVSLNFSQPTRLLRIVKRLEQETDSRLVINWASLALQGWYADSRSSLFANGEPLDTVLEQLFQPTPVTLSALGSSLYHVAADVPIAARRHIVFYPTGHKLTLDQANEQIRSLIQTIGTAHFRDSGGDGAICFDAPSDCLIVRLPTALQSLVESQLRRPRDF